MIERRQTFHRACTNLDTFEQNIENLVQAVFVSTPKVIQSALKLAG